MLKLNLLFVTLFIATSLVAQIPSGYYNTATGTSYVLKTQLYNKIKSHTDHGYGGLWITYSTSDRDHQYENDNTIFDIYSEKPFALDSINFVYNIDQCGTYSAQGDCYNREHLVPQSIYNSASPMVSDAHFVIPSDGYVNNQRSNFPHGKVATTQWVASNGTKRGTSAVSGYVGSVFEPLDDFKGDVARMYFYFATRYENLAAGYTSYPMFNGTNDTVFKNNFLTMLLDWHNADSVSVREIERNNAIYARQNNRNPFIDHPEFVGMIWGGNVMPIAQSITFNALPNVINGSANFTLTATASSNLPVSYSSSDTGVATIVGNVVTIVGAGNTIITASQLGNANYSPATPVNQNLIVTPIVLTSQTITFNALQNKTLGDAPFSLIATGGASGNPITYISSNPMIASIVGNVVTILSVGTTNITALQMGNATYAAASDVIQSLTVINSISNSVIAAWDFHSLVGGVGTNNFGVSPFASSYTNGNLIVGGLTRGSGIGTPSGSSAAARGWGGTVNTASALSAMNSNTFISFTLNTNQGYALDLNSFNPIDYRRSTTGATNALVQYKINGGSFVDIATLNFSVSTSSGSSAGSIDLLSIADLQNIHSSDLITFRILPYGGTGGTFYLFDRANSSAYDFSVLGNVRLCLPSSSNLNVTTSSSATPYIWNGQNLFSSGIYIDTFINSVGCDSVVSLHLSVINNNATINIKALLEGFYLNGSLMQAVLFDEGISSNANDCDSVILELHDWIYPYQIAFSQQSILHSDGEIVCTTPSIFVGNNYYIVIKHRNSIETWSASPMIISNNLLFDFTTNASKAYGSNQVEVSPNVFAFYSGDINQDDLIDNSDYTLWESDANNFASGYLSTDLNGDGAVDNGDYIFWETNSNGFVGVVMP